MSTDSPRFTQVELQDGTKVIAKPFVVTKERKFREYFEGKVKEYEKVVQENYDFVTGKIEESGNPEEDSENQRLIIDNNEKVAKFQLDLFYGAIEHANMLFFHKTQMEHWVEVDSAGNPKELTEEFLNIASYDDMNEIAKAATGNDFLGGLSAAMKSHEELLKRQIQNQL